MDINIKEKGNFRYIDEGSGPVLLLLHGLFGALSNWVDVITTFSPTHRILIPMLPIYEMPHRSASVDGLVDFTESFVTELGLDKMVLMGNSLGGHVGLVYTLRNSAKVTKLVLTGSSGLFENSMGGSFPKRGNYEYIRERVGYTFYDPKVATKELVDEVFETTNNTAKCFSIVSIAKSAQRHNMAQEVKSIKIPTLLVWGLNDMITPPEVGHEFNRLIPNSTLRFIDHCGHAAMMERSDVFNQYLKEFLDTK